MALIIWPSFIHDCLVTRDIIIIPVAHCFMEWEAENYFSWALEILRDLCSKFQSETHRVIFMMVNVHVLIHFTQYPLTHHLSSVDGMWVQMSECGCVWHLRKDRMSFKNCSSTSKARWHLPLLKNISSFY